MYIISFYFDFLSLSINIHNQDRYIIKLVKVNDDKLKE